MDKRLFWLIRSDFDLSIVGYVLDIDQLRSELSRETVDFKLDEFLNGDTRKFAWGEIKNIPGTTFLVKEVGSLKELKFLMTWKGYNPQEQTIVPNEPVSFTYPDFVHEDFRIERKIYTFTPHTSVFLPITGGDNPLIRELCSEFKITTEYLHYVPTELEFAACDIADVLEMTGSISQERYCGILEDFGFDDYIPEDGRQL